MRDSLGNTSGEQTFYYWPLPLFIGLAALPIVFKILSNLFLLIFPNSEFLRHLFLRKSGWKLYFSPALLAFGPFRKRLLLFYRDRLRRYLGDSSRTLIEMTEQERKILKALGERQDLVVFTPNAEGAAKRLQLKLLENTPLLQKLKQLYQVFLSDDGPILQKLKQWFYLPTPIPIELETTVEAGTSLDHRAREVLSDHGLLAHDELADELLKDSRNVFFIQEVEASFLRKPPEGKDRERSGPFWKLRQFRQRHSTRHGILILCGDGPVDVTDLKPKPPEPISLEYDPLKFPELQANPPASPEES